MVTQSPGNTWDEKDDIHPDQTEFATELRIPFLDTPYPKWNYAVGVVIFDFFDCIVPTDDDANKIADLRDVYLDTWYPEPDEFREQMKEFAPYDILPRLNLGYLAKHRDNTWSYFKRSMTGPHWWPDPMNRPKSLEEILAILNPRPTS